MKSFFKEFKDFAIQGNMLDMAIGIIIGTSFNSVVNTLVKKVVMPPLSLMTDGVNLVDKKYVLRESSEASGGALVDEVAIGYGEMIEVLIDFVIIAFTIFIVVKFLNRLKNRSRNPSDKEVKTPKEIELLSQIEKRLADQNELLSKKN